MSGKFSEKGSKVKTQIKRRKAKNIKSKVIEIEREKKDVRIERRIQRHVEELRIRNSNKEK